MIARLAVAMLLLWQLAFGQAPPAPLKFDAASVKPADSSAPRPGRFGSVEVVTSPGHLSARNAKLPELIRAAYGVQDYQVSGGPAWVESAGFDVEAKAEDGANRARLLLMLQTLLAERFRLAIHRETKEIAIYALVLAKGGPRFHALTADEAKCWPGCASAPGTVNHMRQKDLPSLAAFLTRLGSDRPVIDETGLKGNFALEFDMSKILEDADQGAAATRAAVFEAAANALPDALGLRLAPEKTRAETIVIDHVEKPAAN